MEKALNLLKKTIMKGKAKFKVLRGKPVLLCSKCDKIIKESKYFTDEDWMAYKEEIKMPAQICDECEEIEMNK